MKHRFALVLGVCLLLSALPAFGKPPIRAVRNFAGRRVWAALTTASLGAAAADVYCTTQILREGGYETDPLARPFTNLPTPAYAAVSMAGAAGVDWLGLRMQRSRHLWIRRFWWAPQIAQIQFNIVGAAYSARH
jgi:hypothetical protein